MTRISGFMRLWIVLSVVGFFATVAYTMSKPDILKVIKRPESCLSYTTEVGSKRIKIADTAAIAKNAAAIAKSKEDYLPSTEPWQPPPWDTLVPVDPVFKWADVPTYTCVSTQKSFRSFIQGLIVLAAIMGLGFALNWVITGYNQEK